LGKFPCIFPVIAVQVEETGFARLPRQPTCFASIKTNYFNALRVAFFALAPSGAPISMAPSTDVPSANQAGNQQGPKTPPPTCSQSPVGGISLLPVVAGLDGVKVTILLEERLALGRKGAEYDALLIKIGDGDQFCTGFVEVNPNSKIPALLDHSARANPRL